MERERPETNRPYGGASVPGRRSVPWRERLRGLWSDDAAALAAQFGGDESSRGAEGPRLQVLRDPAPEAPTPDERRVKRALRRACQWLLARQERPGHWVAELEADTTLESYFIIWKAFFGRREDPKVPKYARTILDDMLPEGGWAIYEHGPPEVSVSVLSYFALKVAGLPADDPAMRRSREMILKLGGAARANTYTKFHLAFFGQYPWDHVPAIPPEMIFLPKRVPINIYEISSWSRTIFVPLSILSALKPVRLLPPECRIDELFAGGRGPGDLALPRTKERLTWTNFFLLTDRALKLAERFPIQKARQAALKRAERWMVERFEASGGLGAILPAMMSSVLAMKSLGYSDDHPLMEAGCRELEALELHDPRNDSIRIQPCHSPVWDTAIAVYALAQAGLDRHCGELAQAVSWLLSKEVKRPGDWQVKNPVPPGGWYFEYENEFYPDVDDTIMVMMALRQVSPKGFSRAVDEAIHRALNWVLGMQNENGGWASFDRNNNNVFLTKAPFADHNAMIDPSTADITGRTLEMLATIAPEVYTVEHPVVRRALEFLRRDQCSDGSWFGRWGVNYLYGTWQVLRGLRLIGEEMRRPCARKAVEWLKAVQLSDGGWGERADTYVNPALKGLGPSTASQTAWAVMGLLAAGEGGSPSTRAGVNYLLSRQLADGTWDEDEWTGTGFPCVFYLKYHYYRHYWPLMALAQYERFRRGLRP